MKHTTKHTIFHPAHVLLFSAFLLSKAIANKTISAVSLALYLSLALASCGSGGGGGSSQSSGASEKLSAALAAPSGLTATVKSATEITLSWSATTNATFYEVYRGTSSNSADSTKKSDTTLTSTSYASTGLTPRTDYYYWLKACNSSGCSGFSTVAKATTPRAEFITTWKVEAGDLEITIPTNPDASLVYKYNVDCNDNGTDDVINATGDAICPAYAKAGTYTVAISGDFPAIFFANTGDKDKILTVENWGTINWKTMDNAFSGASNLTLTATDVPDLSEVTDMTVMFYFASHFNGDVSKWNVFNVTDMRHMFDLATSFNSDISGWDVSNVTSMRAMFQEATTFNQDISGWTVSKVTECTIIFSGSGMSTENLNKIKSTDGWLRSVNDGGLPTGSTCRGVISALP